MWFNVLFLWRAAAARLPSFHCCVGANEEKLSPKWYKEHGNSPHIVASRIYIYSKVGRNIKCYRSPARWCELIMPHTYSFHCNIFHPSTLSPRCLHCYGHHMNAMFKMAEMGTVAFYLCEGEAPKTKNLSPKIIK